MGRTPQERYWFTQEFLDNLESEDDEGAVSPAPAIPRWARRQYPSIPPDQPELTAEYKFGCSTASSPALSPLRRS